MDHYDDERPRRHRSTRERRIRDDYDTDPHHRSGDGALARRPRTDSYSSIEEVSRDFPPAGGYSRRTTERQVRRARSAGGHDRYGGDPYDDRSSYHDDYAGSKRGSRRDDDRRKQPFRDHFMLF